MLDRDVLALHITEVAESLEEGPPKVRALRRAGRYVREDTDPKDLSWLLRAGGERHREDNDGEGRDDRNRSAPHGGSLGTRE